MKTCNKWMLLALIAVLGVSCGTKKESTEVEQERIEQVKTMTLQAQAIERKIELSTTLLGYEEMVIAPSVTGKIERIFVEVGSRVRAGEQLVRMDQQQYNTAKLTYANLLVEEGRMAALRESGTISQQAYDQTKLSLDQTKENLDFLETNTFVKARFSGVISAKNYEEGELYSGQGILTLTQINQLKAFIAIPETFFPMVKSGMKVEIYSDLYPNHAFSATIETIYPTIDASTHTFQVKLRVPNGNEQLRPGMYVRTTVGLGKSNAMVVPYQSVLKLVGSNDRYVFINEGGKAKRIPVTLGQRYDEQIEIISAEITDGAELVCVGQAKLIDGVKLNVVK